MEFTCLAFQEQCPKWNARQRKAERGKSKGAKPRLMTHMAKLFCLYRVLRHQHLQRINEEKRKIFPQLNLFRVWNNFKLSNNLSIFATSICSVQLSFSLTLVPLSNQPTYKQVRDGKNQTFHFLFPNYLVSIHQSLAHSRKHQCSRECSAENLGPWVQTLPP